MGIWQRPIYVADLMGLKSKYPSFFSARSDFRHTGMDVSIGA